MVRILIRLIYQFPINCQKQNKKIKKTKQFLLKILGKQYSTSEIFQSKCNAHIRTISNEYTKWIFFSFSFKYWCWTNTRSHFNFLSKPYTQLFSHRFHFGDIFSFIICIFFDLYLLFICFFLLENKFYARKE